MNRIEQILFVRFCVASAELITAKLTKQQHMCLYQECLQMADYLGDIHLKTQIYFKLKDLSNNMVFYLKQVLAIARQRADKDTETETWFLLCMQYYELQRYDDALICAEKLLEIAREIGSKVYELRACYFLGQIYHSLNQYDDAVLYGKKCIDIAKDIDDKESEMNMYLLLGQTYLLLKEYDNAILYSKQCIDIAKTVSGYKKSEMKAYLVMGNAHHLLYRQDEALVYFKKCIDIAKTVGDKHVEKLAYLASGNAYNLLHQYDKAIFYAKKSIDIAMETNDKASQMSAYLVLGSAYHSLNRHDDAVLYGKKCIDIAMETNDKASQMRAYFVLGKAYHSLNQYDDAVLYGKKCIDIAKTVGDEQIEKLAYLASGNAYNLLYQYDKAIFYAKKSIEIAIETNDKASQMRAYFVLGKAYHSLNQYDDAVLYGKKCIDIAMETNDKASQMRAYFVLGKAYHSLNQYDDAVLYGKKCLDIAIETNEKASQMRAYFVLGKAYHSLNQYDDAVLYGKKCIDIAKDIDDKENELNMYLFLGQTYLSLKECDNAVLYSKQCIDIARETIDDKAIEMSAYLVMGKAHRLMYRQDEALVYYKKCIDIAKTVGDKRVEKVAYLASGIAYSLLYQYDKAIFYAKKSVDIAMETNDKASQIRAYFVLGNAYHSLNRHDDAVIYCKKCIDIAKTVSGYKQFEMKAYLVSGSAFLVFNQFEDAIFNSKKCSDIAKETGDKEHEMKAYLVFGRSYFSLKQYDNAILYCEKCIDIAKEIDDRESEMNAYLLLGEMYNLKNQYDASILNHNKCIDIAKETGDKETELTAHFQMGLTSKSLSQYDDILNCKNCIGTTRETGDNRTQVNAFFVDILYKIGDLISHLNRGIAIAVEVNDNIKKEAFEFMFHHIISYLNEIGNSKILKSLLAGSSGDEDDYQTLIRENLWEAKTTNYTTRMITLLILSRYHASQHEYEKAIRCVQKVLMDLEPRFLKCYINAHCHEVLAENYLELNQFDKSLAHLHLGLPNAKQCCFKVPELKLSYKLGKLYFALGRKEESKHFLGEAIRCTNSLFEDRQHNFDDYIAIQLFDGLPDSHKDLSEVLIQTNQIKEAFLVLDQCRARELKQILLIKYGMKGVLTNKEHIQYSDIECLVSTNKYSIQFYFVCHNNLRTFVVEGGKELQLSSKCINNCKECLMMLIQNTFDEIQVRQATVSCENRSLDTALQNIQVNEEEHHHDEEEHHHDEEDHHHDEEEHHHDEEEHHHDEEEHHHDEEEHHHDEEDESRKGQRRNVEEHRSPFDLRGQPTEASDESSMTSALEVLYRELMGKVSIEEDEIVIIPDGPLFSVPYSALRDPDTGRYLSETKRIRIAPSITTLKLLHECPVGHHCMKGGLIIGDPFVGEVMYLGERKLFPPLIFAAAEARVIASILGVQPMIGRQATKSAVIEALNQEIAIIHIAAHGSLENATIALSPSSETKDKAIPDEEDYMLTMADVQKAHVRAQLAVLSCCHSGRGEIKAEGVVGMCRAFLASGARAVVGSLWAISDDATLEFMARFYSHIKNGKSASTSLQQTIKATLLSQEYSEPKYWAPFFLIGDDVTINI